MDHRKYLWLMILGIVITISVEGMVRNGAQKEIEIAKNNVEQFQKEAVAAGYGVYKNDQFAWKDKSEICNGQ